MSGAPAEQFGKLMSIPDALLPMYLQYATAWSPETVEDATTRLSAGTLHPNAAKRLLSRTVVDLYHGEGAGAAAEAEFDRVFVAHEAPEDVPEVQIPAPRVRVATLLRHAFPSVVPSNNEGRRKIVQGGVRLDGE